MNKVLTLMKSILKQMIANLPVMLLAYVVFPAALAFFMGGAFQMGDSTEIEKLKIMIEDADKTVASETLVDFFESKEVSKYIEIEDTEKSQVIKIPKGYGVALENGTDFDIELIETSEHNGDVIEDMLKGYHKQMLLEADGVSTEEIAVIMTGGVVKDIASKEEVTSASKASENMGVLAVGFISTIIVMFLNSYTASRCLDYSKHLATREGSTPNSQFKLIFYGMMGQGLMVLSMMAIYIAIFRITGYGFTGNLAIIALMSIVSALFGFVAATFIGVLTPPKVGMVVGMIIMLLTMLSNFKAPFLGRIGEINPLAAISDMFTAYQIHGTFDVIATNLIHILATIGIMTVAIIIRVRKKKVIA